MLTNARFRPQAFICPGLHMHAVSAQTRHSWRNLGERLSCLQVVAMSEGQWMALEKKVEELIELTSTLSKENHALRAQQRNWTTERAKLIEKNELAKSRVESMITRLKALEQD